MRIKSILQPPAFSNDGLSTIDIRGLNQIVIVAGANGSGKSRLLQRIQNGVSPFMSANLSMNGIEFESVNRPLSAPVSFVSKELILSNPALITKQEIMQLSQQAVTPGMVNFAKATLPYIQRVQDHWRNVNHQNSSEDQSVVKEKNDSYELLSELICTILGESLERDIDDNPTLFNKPIFSAGLSDGQNLLLQWCVALHSQGRQLSELILLMDEPENHLHPESMISTIERIIEANDKGQIWIATHSVPLVAAIYKKHATDVSLYFMENGEISYASEKPEKVLKSLMGGEQNIEALREFIDLPEVFATNRFAAQCLLSPDVIPASSSSNMEPQSQIVNQDISSTPKKIKMLDFGCGKGRILESLLARHNLDLPQRLDYVGWDPSVENREQCEQVIKKAYQDSTNRWFCDRQLLAKHHPGKPFDRILLCNVLHEINPKEWCSLFDEASVINQSLAESGELLIIEDYLMPKGEYAHPFGFIVLDTQPLQALFASGSGDKEIKVEDGQNGRVRGHFIPKKLLANVTQDTTKAALKLAQRNAKEKIEKLRNPNNDNDFKSGREHGFWVQQYANTTLALEP
jgi:ABC-type cobalamin/Fe3+-siderophores transport system ATPase subunit/SAM-dependent methyltransferase